MGYGAHIDDLRRRLEGKRVLLTGSTGFKGGWMALWLAELGARVVGIGLPPEDRSFMNAVGLAQVVDTRIADIRDRRDFASAVEGEDFDILVHMAAQSLVRKSYADPVDTFQTNVVGTAVVLEAARRMPSLRAIVVVSSDKCYDNREWVWPYRETDPMGGHDPYSASKGCTELIASAYRKSFFHDPDGPRLASVRAGNVIGGGDWSRDRIVPDLVRSAETREPARIRNPHSVRPWQHVLEPLRGYLMLAAALVEEGHRYAGGWNFGPAVDADIDVGTLAELVRRSWPGQEPGPGPGPGPEYTADPVKHTVHEANMLRLDSTKARVELGWQPALALEQAVDLTVGWYHMALQRPERMLDFTRQQIGRYCACCQDPTHEDETLTESRAITELAACG
ncbi:CDP-glucose 4,6-dehydratase [Pararhizobium mangrovi]|uniref:CDP-glucose 4,6-dehydratase n=1 Tax=Pararhizobium mangrovi TaxID=2590452 RepID=A0A506U685_9HYPH|nr:CDP-glucose 4,6-dehydratase [Pararhizobium mangrovi]TPW28998.1 CDP-glucose 4,6-dehydratase [Pararhizobium mangrovi]